MKTPILVGVLAVQGDVREHEQALQACGVTVQRVRTTEELAKVDGLVIPGGESTVMDKICRTFGLFDPLQTRVSQGMPVYGSCAGMIMLAQKILDGHQQQKTIGGIEMTVRRNAFGRQVDSFETDLAVQGLDSPYRAIFIRAPWVESVSEKVEILAKYNDAIVAVRQENLLATSFHPEMTKDYRIHQLFIDMVRSS